jgi:hypothetical protein
MTRTQPLILKYLKAQGRDSNLPLHILRQFEEFEKTLAHSFKSFDQLPPEQAYVMRSFKKIEMLGVCLCASGEYSAANSCFEDIIKRFDKDIAFSDGVSLLAWILFNFPINSDGTTLATEVLKKFPDLTDELSPFVDAMNHSRLGVYEARGDGQDSSRLKELFTGKRLTLNHALQIPRGKIAILRVLTLADQSWAFGDSGEFPGENRLVFENMVKRKMSVYFPDKDPLKSYETMMRLAGPYWFSILARESGDDILEPNHYLSYQ